VRTALAFPHPLGLFLRLWRSSQQLETVACDTCDVDQRLAVLAPLPHVTPLVRCQLQRAPHMNTTRLSAVASISGADPDEFALELSKSTEDCQNQAAVRSGGVRPRTGQRLEARALAGDGVRGVEQGKGSQLQRFTLLLAAARDYFSSI
jgi:hypothetical protein